MHGEWQWVFDAVTAMVRSVAVADDELHGRLHELVEQQGPIDDVTFSALEAHARAALAAQRAAEKTWTAPTVNDRIDRAFADLDASDIVALQNAGYTQSDGWQDVGEQFRERNARGRTARGGTFFHQQDVARGVKGEGLMLTFGAVKDEDLVAQATAERAIALDVVEALARRGVLATWNGDLGSRIEIAPFPWQKRLYTRREDADAPPMRIPFRREGASQESIRREQARQITNRLLEDALLELGVDTPRARAALERGLADALGDFDGADAADDIIDWLVEQQDVGDVFVETDALRAILAGIDPPLERR